MRVIVNGAGGRMGSAICALISSGYRGCELAAAVDRSFDGKEAGKYAKLADYGGKADCLIDFSHHSATGEMLEYAVSRMLPAVIATTAQTAEERDMIIKAAQKIPVFFSANMSIGVALLAQLAAKAAQVFPDADVEIIETHHHNKLDVPSGTALMIADAVKEARGSGELNIGRHDDGKRPAGEIGIHSVRLGSEVGDHKVMIATENEIITIEHRAQNRNLFAEGAVAAACWIADKADGLYGMKELMGE